MQRSDKKRKLTCAEDSKTSLDDESQTACSRDVLTPKRLNTKQLLSAEQYTSDSVVESAQDNILFQSHLRQMLQKKVFEDSGSSYRPDPPAINKILICGPAGCGKTHTTKKAVNCLAQLSDQMVGVLCFTHALTEVWMRDRVYGNNYRRDNTRVGTIQSLVRTGMTDKNLQEKLEEVIEEEKMRIFIIDEIFINKSVDVQKLMRALHVVSQKLRVHLTVVWIGDILQGDSFLPKLTTQTKEEYMAEEEDFYRWFLQNSVVFYLDQDYRILDDFEKKWLRKIRVHEHPNPLQFPKGVHFHDNKNVDKNVKFVDKNVLLVSAAGSTILSETAGALLYKIENLPANTDGVIKLPPAFSRLTEAERKTYNTIQKNASMDPETKRYYFVGMRMRYDGMDKRNLRGKIGTILSMNFRESDGAFTGVVASFDDSKDETHDIGFEQMVRYDSLTGSPIRGSELAMVPLVPCYALTSSHLQGSTIEGDLALHCQSQHMPLYMALTRCPRMSQVHILTTQKNVKERGKSLLANYCDKGSKKRFKIEFDRSTKERGHYIMPGSGRARIGEKEMYESSMSELNDYDNCIRITSANPFHPDYYDNAWKKHFALYSNPVLALSDRPIFYASLLARKWKRSDLREKIREMGFVSREKSPIWLEYDDIAISPSKSQGDGVMDYIVNEIAEHYAFNV